MNDNSNNNSNSHIAYYSIRFHKTRKCLHSKLLHFCAFVRILILFFNFAGGTFVFTVCVCVHAALNPIHITYCALLMRT